ncbi:hypothetical protein C2E23DRAFT_887349 [Lenzites betulinus]|nr:hypothetical protein C2E23DRAFT_887349 [Lenzites betulinus]
MQILVLPTLVPVGIAIVVTKTYGNCVLIALNARQSHTETTGRAQGGLPVGAHFVSTQAETLDLPSAQELWRPQQPKAIVSDTVIELKPCYRGLDRLQ